MTLVCVGAPCAIWIFGSSEITWSFFPISVGFPFIILISANALLKRVFPSAGLEKSELLTVMLMGLVVTGVPIFMVGFLLAVPTTPYYLASPENQWADYVLPYLPEWLLPDNTYRAMTWFFEGLPSGMDIPWSILISSWLIPLFWWLSFIWTLYLVCFAMVVILRKQWIDRERLPFPLMEVPMELVSSGETPSRPALHRSPAFWVGAAIPLFIALWNVAGFFMTELPSILWHHTITVGRDFPPINARLYFPVIGFMYFVHTNVSFSIWFFYIITMLEEGVFNRFGMGITTTDTFVWGLPTTSWQCWGAFVVMTLWSLWMARGHLKDVFRKAWFADKRIDDDGELLSYRTATLCLAGGSAYLLGWLISAGMPWYAGLLFLPGVLIAYLGITRIVVQTGVYYVTTPIVSQAMTLTTLGSQAITPHGLATLGLSYSFFGDVQSIFMPAAAHATRVSDTMRIGRRTLGAAIGIAVIAGFILSIATIVTMGYLYGASNFRSWFYQVSSGAGVRSFEAALMTIRAPTGPDFQKLSYMASGAGVMGLLTFLQYRLPWWPLHPIGLPVAGVWMIRNQAVAIFVAWLVKSLILRFGGNSGYKSGVPFFIGLIVGHFTGVGISFLVDIIFFPGVGHPILHG